MPKITKGEVYKKKYTEEQLEVAIQAIQNGMPKRAAAKEFGIPRGTLQFRIQGNFVKTRPGPPTVLTTAEENTLVEWIVESSRKGFPRRKEELLQSVADFLSKSPRPNNFIDNKPGDGWYKLFLKRHPEIVHRTAEAVTSASANVSEGNIKKWFGQIDTILQEEGCVEILKDPTRVFNGDETNFLLCPKTSKVLALKGTRDVYEVDNAPAKCGLTVMFTFSANGIITPPMIIYPLKRNRADITASVPPEWGIGLSSNGWMNKDLFLQYITNVLYPYLVKENTEFPIILFVDGHKSHINYELSKVCKEMGIILIALYPNATRILQPADVAAFKPIKSAWKKGILDWRKENPTKNLTKTDFAPILSVILKKYINKQIIINGFRTCGLYPWNPNAINYQKCLGKNVIKSTTIPENRLQSTITLTDFEKIVGPIIVSSLLSETPEESDCFYKALKDIHNHLKGQGLEQNDETIVNEYLVINDELMPINDVPVIISTSNNIDESHAESVQPETTDNFETLPGDLFNDLDNVNLTKKIDLSANIQNTMKMQNDNQHPTMKNLDGQNDLKNLMINVDPTRKSNIKGLNQLISCNLTTTAEIHNTDEQNETVENMDIQNEYPHKTIHRNSPVLDNVIETVNYQNQITNTQNNKKYEYPTCDSEMTPPKLKEILHWPITPQRKGKIIVNNPVYVLTSRKWLEIEEKKKQEKEAKEKDKEERKKVREEKQKQAVKSVINNDKNAKKLKVDPENIKEQKKKLDISIKSTNVNQIKKELYDNKTENNILKCDDAKTEIFDTEEIKKTIPKPIAIKQVEKVILNTNSESGETKRKYKEGTQKVTKTKERKRKRKQSTNSANYKKNKIDLYNNETENNTLKYDYTKTKNFDVSVSNTKQNNIKILSVVKTQVNIDPKIIFDENSHVNTKEPCVLTKFNPLVNRRESFRNQEELSNFLNDAAFINF